MSRRSPTSAEGGLATVMTVEPLVAPAVIATEVSPVLKLGHPASAARGFPSTRTVQRRHLRRRLVTPQWVAAGDASLRSFFGLSLQKLVQCNFVHFGGAPADADTKPIPELDVLTTHGVPKQLARALGLVKFGIDLV